MRPRHLITIVAGCFIAALVTGCDARKADRERARLELEEKTRREAEAGNKAITDFNQRVFGKKPPVPAPSEPPKAEPKSTPPSAGKP